MKEQKNIFCGHGSEMKHTFVKIFRNLKAVFPFASNNVYNNHSSFCDDAVGDKREKKQHWKKRIGTTCYKFTFDKSSKQVASEEGSV